MLCDVMLCEVRFLSCQEGIVVSIVTLQQTQKLLWFFKKWAINRSRLPN